MTFVRITQTGRVRRLSDYATAEEIAILRTDLQARWDEEDRVLSKPAPGRRRISISGRGDAAYWVA